MVVLLPGEVWLAPWRELRLAMVPEKAAGFPVDFSGSVKFSTLSRGKVFGTGKVYQKWSDACGMRRKSEDCYGRGVKRRVAGGACESRKPRRRVPLLRRHV